MSQKVVYWNYLFKAEACAEQAAACKAGVQKNAVSLIHTWGWVSSSPPPKWRISMPSKKTKNKFQHMLILAFFYFFTRVINLILKWRHIIRCPFFFSLMWSRHEQINKRRRRSRTRRAALPEYNPPLRRRTLPQIVPTLPTLTGASKRNKRFTNSENALKSVWWEEVVCVFRFQAPARDEESESQRKARSKLLRQTRRPTQVMLLIQIQYMLFSFLFFLLTVRIKSVQTPVIIKHLNTVWGRVNNLLGWF